MNKEIMQINITNQLKDATGVTKEILDEMKQIRLKYGISHEEIENTLGRIKPGDKRFYCMVERIQKSIDPETDITKGTLKIVDMLCFWESELEEFLNDFDLEPTEQDSKILHVKRKENKSSLNICTEES